MLFCPFVSFLLFLAPSLLPLTSLPQGLFKAIFEKQLLDFLISQFYFYFINFFEIILFFL